MRFNPISSIPLATLSLGLAGVAHAAPANDDFADATVIDAVPFYDVQDTRDASVEADEPNAYPWVSGPTVWYAFTPDADMSVSASTEGSGPETDGCFAAPEFDCYDTTVAVWADFGGFLGLVTSNDDAGPGTRMSRASWTAFAGETYYIQVGTYDGLPGGDLVFSVEEYTPPPPYELAPTVTSVRSGLRSGEVRVSGTITCSEPGWFNLNADVLQVTGRHRSHVFAWADGECDTEPTTWTAWYAGNSDGGTLVGRATWTVAAFGGAYATGQFGSGSGEGAITVKGAR